MPPMYPMGLLEFHQHGWHVLQQIQGLEGEETLMAQRFCASVVTVGHGSPFDYPSASMHIGKNKRNKPLAAGIAIYTSSCHLFAGRDPDFFIGVR